MNGDSYYPDEINSQNFYTIPDQNYYQNFYAPDQNYYPNNYSWDYYYCYTNDYNNPENNQSSQPYPPEPIISSNINNLKTPEPAPTPDQLTNYYQNFYAPDQNYYPNNYSQDYYYCYTNDYNNPENNQSSQPYPPEPIISSNINNLKTPEPAPTPDQLTQPISRPPPPLKRTIEKRITDDVLFTTMVNDIMRLTFKKWKLLYYDNAKTQWDNYLEWATYTKNLRVCSQIYELPDWTDNIFYLTDEQYTTAITTKGRDFSLSQLFLLAKWQDRRRRKAGRGKSLSARYQFPPYVYTMTSREILEKFVNNDGPVVTFEYLQHASIYDMRTLVKNVDDSFKKALIRFVRTRANHKLKIDNFE